MKKCIDEQLLAKSISTEFPLPPALGEEPTLTKILEQFAFLSAPLNENSKSYDPNRPFFDYSTALDIPEIEKDFENGNFEKHLPVDHSHPYVKLFIENDFSIDHYEKVEAFKNPKKKIIERKPLRIEAIIKIQRALGVRGRSQKLFSISEQILQNLIEDPQNELTPEMIMILEEEYEDLIGLCKDSNYFLKKGSIKAELGNSAYGNLNFFDKFKKKSNFKYLSNQ